MSYIVTTARLCDPDAGNARVDKNCFDVTRPKRDPKMKTFVTK